MNTIKVVLTFLFGAFLASLYWIWGVFPVRQVDGITVQNGFTVIAAIVAVVLTIIVVIGSAFWLAEHWSDN